jgi:hypothetical protein
MGGDNGKEVRLANMIESLPHGSSQSLPHDAQHGNTESKKCQQSVLKYKSLGVLSFAGGAVVEECCSLRDSSPRVEKMERTGGSVPYHRIYMVVEAWVWRYFFNHCDLSGCSNVYGWVVLPKKAHQR